MLALFSLLHFNLHIGGQTWKLQWTTLWQDVASCARLPSFTLTPIYKGPIEYGILPPLLYRLFNCYPLSISCIPLSLSCYFNTDGTSRFINATNSKHSVYMQTGKSNKSKWKNSWNIRAVLSRFWERATAPAPTFF